ncbi:MAG: hypothetical protein QM817_36660 [Archangium sp.]
MPSPARKTFALIIEHPVEVQLIKAHMAGSLGQEKADAVVAAALRNALLPTEGQLAAEQAESLLSKLATEPGLVGLAAKVTKQMVRNRLAPIAPR